MRAFDTWNSYLDNDGNLLHGKVRFCRKGTTDNVTIYNSDGNAIRNPEFTDMLGRTEYQVFLDGSDDVTAYFYKYVGTGDMAQWPNEDYDPSRWAYQYSSDNMDPTSSLDISAASASGVSTMSDLRAVNPDEVPSVNGVKLMWMYGYYSGGDTSPVLYVWDSASLDSDDGGATIMSNHAPGRGRWKLATRELHFDVRHFGIFPLSDKYSTDYSYTSQLANCAAYIDKEGLDAWFPALNDNLSYYLFDGTNTFSIKGDVFISDAVRFQVKTGTSGTAITCHEIHKRTPYLFDSSLQTGSVTLTADWINISWVGGNCTGDARIGWVIDSDAYTRIITGKAVNFICNGSAALQLDNCVITSSKKITGDISIKNSVLRTDFFADNYDWSNLTSINNDIRLANCKDARTYITLKNKQSEATYGDLGEQSVAGVTLLDGAVAENAYFDGVTLAGDAELHNVSGRVYIQNPAHSINMVDCWLTISNLASVVFDSVSWRRGNITMSTAYRIQVLNTLYLDNVDVGACFYTPGVCPRYLDCRINMLQQNFKDVEYVGCTFNTSIEQYPETYDAGMGIGSGQYMNGLFTRNVFLSGAKILLKPIAGSDYSGYMVGCMSRWIANCSDHDFVDDTAWSGVARSSVHLVNAEYSENHGGCPVEKIETGNRILTYTYTQVAGDSSYLELPSGIADTTALWLVADWRSAMSHCVTGDLYWLLNIEGVTVDVSKLFRFKALKTTYSVQAKATVQSFVNCNAYGTYTNTFAITSPLISGTIASTATSATLATPNVLRFAWTGYRFNGNSDIDEHRSALWYAAYSANATDFHATLAMTLTLA